MAITSVHCLAHTGSYRNMNKIIQDTASLIETKQYINNQVSFTVEPLINTCNTNTKFSFIFFYENLLCYELLHFFQQFTSARYVRLSLQKIRTLNADLMTLRRNFESKFIDPSVTERVSITVWFADSSQSSVSIPNVIIISFKINLFSPWYSWKIAELALNNNHSLYHAPWQGEEKIWSI